MRVIPVPQLADNYAYLIVDQATNEAAIVDCAEATPVLAEVERQRARLTTVLATHHHFDHPSHLMNLFGYVAYAILVIGVSLVIAALASYQEKPAKPNIPTATAQQPWEQAETEPLFH